MSTTAIKYVLDFGYSQFLIYDESIALPGCDWSDEHFSQGFARRESAVSFRTLLEFGTAELTVAMGPYALDIRYQRAIAVPFLVVSGLVAISGPEDSPGEEKTLKLPLGNYRLTVAQYATGEDAMVVDLFWELDDSIRSSSILVADGDLAPPSQLVETANPAELA